MKLDFIRFKAIDQVELQGWLTNEPGDTAVLHIHGMSGNGYENYFLDNLREMYTKHNISFFSFDNRGRGNISDFRQNEGWKSGGSCYEIFEESISDIQGALDVLKKLKKTRIILQGHSLGCTKVVHYLVNQKNTDIVASILLAPTDMVGWAKSHPKHKQYLSRAKALLSQGRGRELVDTSCWLDKIPISAQTYLTICLPGTNADIYGEREGGALLGKIQIPALIVYGDRDIGLLKNDGSIDAWLKRVSEFQNLNTKVSIIKGAEHGFRGYEIDLSKVVEPFLNPIKKIYLHK